MLYILPCGQATSTLQFYGTVAGLATHVQAVDATPSFSTHAAWV